MPLQATKDPCIILAGAGTGKTFTIVEKIKYLIENKIYQPEKIVCITFSNEAANSLKIRVHKALNLEINQEPIIKTFHAFSADLLRQHGNLINIPENFQILTPDDAKIILHNNLNIAPAYCHKYISTIGTAKDLGITIEAIENWLNNKLANYPNIEKTLENAQFLLQTLHLQNNKSEKDALIGQITQLQNLLEIKKFLQAWKNYEKLKAKKNYQDYSDLNKNALQLLKEHPEIANNYDYIIVDEFQDTNKLQVDFLIALAPHKNITIVGDMNQSIYRFRGAYKNNLDSFKKAFPNYKTFALDKSHRSPNKVLRTAHQLIKNNYENPEECFLVENSYNKEGEKIQVYELKNNREEARKILEIIQQELQSRKPEDICILFRTHQQSRLLKSLLDYNKISYVSVTTRPLLKQKSIKTCINYLTILEKLRAKSQGGEQAWWDLFYNSNFSKNDLIKLGRLLKEKAKENSLSIFLLNSLQNQELSEQGKFQAKILLEKLKILIPSLQKSVPELIQDIYNVSGLRNNEKNQEAKETQLNLNKFYELAKEQSELYEQDLSSFLHYLDSIEKLDIKIEAPSIEDSGIRLMTLHATKGLEYPIIILANMVDKKFPIIKHSNNPLIPAELSPELSHLADIQDFESAIKEYEKANQLLEERRLCYVAFTRTKEKLYITYANQYSEKKFYPSQFLKEINYKNNPNISFNIDTQELYSPPEIIQQSNLSSLTNFESIIEKPQESKTLVLSPSSLLTFIECQKKYEYKYIYNMPEKHPLSWEAMRLGSFIHHVLESAVKNNMKSEKALLDLAKEMHLKEEWESVELDEAIPIIRVFFQRHKNKYNQSSKTEQVLNTEIAGIKFTGFADRIDYNEDGLEIIDYKTGVASLEPRNRNWQLGYYALAIQKQGEKVKKITIDMLRHNKPLEFSLDEQGNAKAVDGRMEFNIYEVESQLAETAEKILKAYQQGFKPCPIDSNCDFCNEYIYENQ